MIFLVLNGLLFIGVEKIEEKVFLASFLQSFSFYYQFVNDLQFKSNYGKIVS